MSSQGASNDAMYNFGQSQTHEFSFQSSATLPSRPPSHPLTGPPGFLNQPPRGPRAHNKHSQLPQPVPNGPSRTSGPQITNRFRPDNIRGNYPRGRINTHHNDRPRNGRPYVSKRRPMNRPLMRAVAVGDDEEIVLSGDGQTKFRSIEESSVDDGSSDGEIIIKGASQTSAHENLVSSKRQKLNIGGFDASALARPKWSNPFADASGLAPDEEEYKGPNKDIVKMIRKAKIETEKQDAFENGVVANEDFLTFGFEPLSQGTKSRKHGLHNTADKRGNESSASEMESHSRRPNQSRGLDQSDSGLDPPHPQRSSGRKRKRDEADGCVLFEWEAGGSRNATPWYDREPQSASSLSTMTRLHEEILDFYFYLSPTKRENAVRQALIDEVDDFIARRYRNWEVMAFGSSQCDLNLPDCDLDLVMVCNDPGGARRKPGTNRLPNNHWHRLKTKLTADDTQLANKSTVDVILHAKVPLVKFRHDETDIQIDLCAENLSGIHHLKVIRKWKEEYPAMPPIVVLIKQFLLMRGLSEVRFGGLGSFAVVCMVVSMLQLHPDCSVENLAPRLPHHSLAEILLTFFKYYGKEFDYESKAISFNPPGLINKYLPARGDPSQKLAIIDPLNESNDITGGTSQMRLIRTCFEESYFALLRALNLDGAVSTSNANARSLLECLVAGNYNSYDRARDILYYYYQDHIRPYPDRVERYLESHA